MWNHAARFFVLTLSLCFSLVPIRAQQSHQKLSKRTKAALSIPILRVGPLLGKTRSAYDKALGKPAGAQGVYTYHLAGCKSIVLIGSEEDRPVENIAFTFTRHLSDWKAALKRVGLNPTGAELEDAVNTANGMVGIKTIPGTPAGWSATWDVDSQELTLCFAGATGDAVVQTHPSDTAHNATIFSILGEPRSTAEGVLGQPVTTERKHRLFFTPTGPIDTETDVCTYTVGSNKLTVVATYADEQILELIVNTDLPSASQWKQALRMIGVTPTGVHVGDASDLTPLPGLPDRLQALWQTPENTENPHHWFLKFSIEKQRRIR